MITSLSKDDNGSTSLSPKSNVSFRSSGGVGLEARGYSFESSRLRSRGSRMKRGGYDRFVVVVVVTVFVSTHSSANCITRCSLTVAASSCQVRTRWLDRGRRFSMLLLPVEEEVMLEMARDGEEEGWSSRSGTMGTRPICTRDDIRRTIRRHEERRWFAEVG